MRKEESRARPFSSSSMPSLNAPRQLTAPEARETVESGGVATQRDRVARSPGGPPEEPPDDDDIKTEILSYRPQLRARARKLGCTVADAEDLVQDTLERALRDVARFARGSNVRGWLFKIFSNRYIDWLRHERVSRTAPLEPQHDVAEAVTMIPKYRQVEWEEIACLLPQLSPDLREVIELRRQNMKYRDIAQRLGIPENTVATRVRTAVDALRRMLGLAPEEDD